MGKDRRPSVRGVLCRVSSSPQGHKEKQGFFKLQGVYTEHTKIFKTFSTSFLTKMINCFVYIIQALH